MQLNTLLLSFDFEKHRYDEEALVRLSSMQILGLTNTTNITDHIDRISWRKTFNPLKTKRICFIYGLSAYRAVNTPLRL
jgi:hypothetical protein